LTYNTYERILLELLAKLHAGNMPFDLSEIIQTYLASFWMLYPSDRAPKAFNDLVIDIRYLNHIFMVVSDSIAMEKSFVDQFKKRIMTRAVSSNDTLLITLAQENLPSTLDTELQDLPIDMHNYLLFSLAPTRSVQALEFLKKNRVDSSRILGFCYRAGLHKEVALYHEEMESYKRAAEVYQENGYFSDALRCYTKINDYLGMAKTLEAMLRFEDALALYTKLGKKTAIARIKKKLQRKEYIQKELF
jgi:tetratricopeptide (TPR) repeat protein